MTEQEVAALVVAWLESSGLDVYQEVAVSGGVADIVATRGAEVWIVEVKTGWSLDVLQQCLDRKRICHRVFAAVPSARGWSERAALASALGIGAIRVTGESVELRSMPPRLTSRRLDISKRLCPEHKTHAKAGAVGAGGRWTPWRRTCEAVRDFVTAHPGSTLKAVIGGIEHHYASASSAKGSIATWARRGVIPGVRLDEGPPLSLWPTREP